MDSFRPPGLDLHGTADAELVLVAKPGPSLREPPEIVFANERLCSTLGYDASELLGRGSDTLIRERDRDSEVERHLEVLRTGGPLTVGKLLKKKSGEVLYSEWDARRLDDAELGPLMLATGRVIDRRRSGEMRNLIAAVEHASDAILIYELVDDTGHARVQYANNAAEAMTGYLRGELEFADRTGPLSDTDSLEALVAAIRRGEQLRSRQRFYRKDGSVYWAEINVRPFVEEDPGVRRWISIERDITEAVEREGLLLAERDAYSTLADAAGIFLDCDDRAQLAEAYERTRDHLLAAGRREAFALLERMYEASLRRLTLYEESIARRNATIEAQSAQADVMAMLAHDIRGPINTIVGFGELIVETAGEETEVGEYARLIVRASNRIVDLTNEVAVSSQIDRNEYQPVPERFDLLSLIESVVALLPGADRVRFDFAEDALGVEADLGAMRHIVSNLTSNALKYSDRAEEVVVGVRAGDKTAEIIIRDRGIGIPADELSTIFDRYTRASNAKSSKIKGTGLGLYFVKQLVERSGGSIAVESMVGEGTTVTVRIPTSTAEAIDAPMIVSVELDGEDRSVIAAELRAQGYAVRVVQTPAAADVLLRHERAKLAIVDEDAIDAATIASVADRCAASQLPLLFTSAAADGSDPMRLRRPIVVDALLRRVDELVREAVQAYAVPAGSKTAATLFEVKT